jgi:hypothetical protein
MIFYLGTHEPSWLPRAGCPLFVSRRRLARLKTSLPRASERWALDSGGFTELNLHGRWETSPARYADEARRYASEIGRMDWAAIQDWMCEPFVLEKTGKTVAEHQHLSTASLVELRSIAPDVSWCPVLQGWRVDDYLEHVELYRSAGFDLAREPIVGVGSVCRRQGTREIADLLSTLSALGLKLHGFGLKLKGLADGSASMASADSLAWSYAARRSAPLPGCGHASCSSCLRFALGWRRKALKAIDRPSQTSFGW